MKICSTDTCENIVHKGDVCPYCKRSLMSNGYIRLWRPDHPMANKDGYVLEHRMVAYDHGYDLTGKDVHHINQDKTDNRIENLEVKSPSQHHKEHVQEQGYVINQFGSFPIGGTPCAVDDCYKKGVYKGLCPMHNRRLKVHGSLDKPLRDWEKRKLGLLD